MNSARSAGFRLAFSGLLLFLLGLALGFAVNAVPTNKPLLSAHEAALGSGTFLISLGAFWSLYMKSAGRLLVPATWLSHYALTGALFVYAFRATQNVATPMLAVSCVAVAIATLCLIARFWIEGRSSSAVAQAVVSPPLIAAE